MNDIMFFNSLISNLGLVELPIKGQSFTWSNMQENPLLEQLDWFFTTNNWTITYPNTLVKPFRVTSRITFPMWWLLIPKFPSLIFSILELLD